MRPDLAKCTTECYRSGAGSIERVYKIKRGGKVRVHPDPEHDYESEFGGFHSSSRYRQYNRKEFGDKLGALKGNLRKNLGRPWDEIFSEFCRHLDRRSLNGWHIWTHLQSEVAMTTYLDGEKIMQIRRYSGEREVSGFYVHPRTGLLCYKLSEGYRAPERVGDLIVPGMEAWKYRQINGLWFRVREIRSTLRLTQTDELIVIEKRSANKAEIAWIMGQ